MGTGPDRLRIGIVGCGDVAYRHYLPALASRAADVAVVAAGDPRPGAADALAAAVADWSPRATASLVPADMLRAERLACFLDLPPRPLHGAVNRAILEAGVACFSEQPIASTLAEADALIELAEPRGRALLCAPGSAATARVRWL